ncbi:hypothetical protein AbraIFM66951_008513 [Aspergillus brasiliensis]|uniref:Transcription factor domain-containing protein n=1 Tax=Aspergillus brasiliensis TaxID=319629 RepID=A0A9W6DN81_9EURO|nr:hypothetical protein AbraCBS73388_009850 [Aspergillus brasiliensis]GKZ45819.1 hypothetical protein AbraIFM66951_008513 [Aspergillus brasiliensis]
MPAPRRPFRFVTAGSRPRKRRRTHNDGSTRTVESQAVEYPAEKVTGMDAEILPEGVSEEESFRARDAQSGDDLANHEPETLDGSIWEDFDFLDSFAPNIFESVLHLDLGLQEPLMTDSPGLPSSDIEELNALMAAEDSPRDQLVIQTLGPTPFESLQNLTREDFDGNSSKCSIPPGPFLPRKSTIFELSPQDHDSLLDMYDSEFCVLPLTSDIPVNPFRCQRQLPQGSHILFHSILALCCQHLKRLTGSWSAEAEEHRRKAVQLLEGALQSKQANDQFHLLEPILILFTLDCALSAAGTWTTHLNRAHSLLQACGGPSALTTPRVRSQVGMLLWWDATLALISRQGTVMHRSYLEFLVRWEKQDEWSFFDLTGCPRDLFAHLFFLAELARQSEIAMSMEWLSFNVTPVMDIEQQLIQWQNDEGSFPRPTEQERDFSDSEMEKQDHEQRDRYHCAEAWRCALLLYVERVFKSDRIKRQPAINRLSRRTLDHIRCCRRSSSQTQKQLLLPIFLAGSETSDEEMRGFVKEYCSYWGDKSRYNMFHSVPALLDEIWATKKWWGAVVDSRTKSPTPGLGKAPEQLLFG